MTDEPRLTEEELERYELEAREALENIEKLGDRMGSDPAHVLRLIAEVRRLRALVGRIAVAAEPLDQPNVFCPRCDGLCSFCSADLEAVQPEPHNQACVWLDVEREADRMLGRARILKAERDAQPSKERLLHDLRGTEMQAPNRMRCLACRKVENDSPELRDETCPGKPSWV